ncbi:hypothetical protein [Mesorhizobium sp. B2-3-5]|uniref:hypothetical protein n=1 Tax=Mesorhizobium sp. B2-3-5 TaxID=2589958 RepID=UPI0015E422DD|nr:hypothetical protein [Mesorhizobium sp. B2-3-5]
MFRKVALTVPRSAPVWPSRRIWITTSAVLLAIALLLIVMSGKGSVPDYGFHPLWFW